MANTLYDILELSPTASADTITANFKRLHAAYAATAAGGDEDAANRMIAAKEAYATLSDPVRRQKYDDALALRMARADVAPPTSGGALKWIMLLLVLGIGGFVVQKHFAEQERVRLQAEQTAAALRMAEIEAERERERDAQATAKQEEQQRRQAEALERFERERAMDYGRQVSRDLERAEERDRQQRAQAERQRQSEAERQLAREKAYLRQLEAENRRRTYY
ncbi:MAG: hypothetical protein CVU18_03535 [Betaproteobacteria bacterium HGW-Betaproteobacteria-12]|nr:MAG: hypothetical protein CVU18_03535 [Betaproteobacteria bacterium HGW-Betaproteobacteria-12]